jgi:hypothetical protein
MRSHYQGGESVNSDVSICIVVGDPIIKVGRASIVMFLSVLS